MTVFYAGSLGLLLVSTLVHLTAMQCWWFVSVCLMPSGVLAEVPCGDGREFSKRSAPAAAPSADRRLQEGVRHDPALPARAQPGAGEVGLHHSGPCHTAHLGTLTVRSIPIRILAIVIYASSHIHLS